MQAPAPNHTAAEIAAHYETLNADEHGEYRARKYDRLLGKEHPASLPLIEAGPQTVDELMKQMDENGCVILKGVLPVEVVRRANEQHNQLIGAVQSEIDGLQRDAYSDRCAI